MQPELIEGETSGTITDGVITEDDLVGEWEGANFEDAIPTVENGGSTSTSTPNSIPLAKSGAGSRPKTSEKGEIDSEG